MIYKPMQDQTDRIYVKDNDIKISVVIPTYNRVNELRVLIPSLLNQSLPKDKFEIIVVDDGSTDSTQEYIKVLQQNNGNLRYIKINNSGRSVARNKGAAEAHGNILAFIDSDCIADKEWLSEIYKEFSANPNLLVARGPVLSDLPNLPPFIHSCIYDENLATGVFAIKKSFFNEIGGFDIILSYYAEDVEIWFKIKKLTSQILFSNKIKVFHPPKYIGYSVTKNYKKTFQWKLEKYLASKHPDKIKFKELCAPIIKKCFFKILIIAFIIFMPFKINIFLKAALLILSFSLISLKRLLIITRYIKKSKINIKIKYVDAFKYILFGWISDFISLLSLLKSFLPIKKQ
jgi:glycosyltransferase involved in cell wall biosynthesis